MNSGSSARGSALPRLKRVLHPPQAETGTALHRLKMVLPPHRLKMVLPPIGKRWYYPTRLKMVLSPTG